MKTKYLLTAAAGLILCLGACKKGELPAASQSATPGVTNVYVAGSIYEQEAAGGQLYTIAAYWKNGAITRLGDSTENSTATGIAVLDNNVYVSGYIYAADDITPHAVVWKNGVATVLASNSQPSEAMCIGIAGNDVYIGGADFTAIANGISNPSAVYWKNGVSATLPNCAVISAITSNGTDVFIAGATTTSNTPNGSGVAAYWKNGGQPVFLNFPTADWAAISSGASGIAVSGTMVASVGSIGDYPPAFWVNSAPTVLVPGSTLSAANGIAIKGSDVYVAGSTYSAQGTQATYWKNNVPIVLPITGLVTGGSSGSLANAICTFGNDIYAAGDGWNNSASFIGSYYWKDGVSVQLSGAGNRGITAKSIVVVSQ